MKGMTVSYTHLDVYKRQGLTSFKKGFSGYAKEYVRTQDYKISFKYYLIRAFETLRKTKRNL